MRSAGIDGIDNTVNLICSNPGPRYIVSAYTVTFHQCLTNKNAIFHLNVFKAHQIGPCGINGNAPETVSSELLVLFNEHIDNFAARLTKTNEKYPHLVTPSNGLTSKYFLLILLSPLF